MDSLALAFAGAAVPSHPMQLAGSLQRRDLAPAFVNHTPRSLEITAQHSSQSPPRMLGPTGMFVPGPLDRSHSAMGNSASSTARGGYQLRRPNSGILREDSIHQISEAQPGELSRPDSWSLICDRTDQAPYLTKRAGTMMTQSSLLTLPKNNASRDLAHFLRTTGPCQRYPSKLESQRPVISSPKNAFRFLTGSHRKNAHQRLNEVLNDEGGLLSGDPVVAPPKGVEQRVTSHGKRYLALQVKDEDQDKATDNAPVLNANILESRVSVCFADDMASNEGIDDWLHFIGTQKHLDQPITLLRQYDSRSVSPLDPEATVRIVDHSSSPVRPAASSLPSPIPDSGVSLAETYTYVFDEHPAKRSLDMGGALCSHPVGPGPGLHGPIPTSPHGGNVLTVMNPSPSKEFEIKHPSPRRFASHPVLLQRASSIASSIQPRSVSDSPGPPPPRSPLRLRRDPRSLESMLGRCTSVRKNTPAPSILAPSIKESISEVEIPIRGTVTTECTGPIKHPNSRGKNTVSHALYPSSKDREDRFRARKMRDRPFQARTIDAVIVSPPVTAPRQRLRKALPHIEHPDLRPAPLAMRTSSTASSTASGKKVAGRTTPASAVSASHGQVSSISKTGYSPNSATSKDSGSVALSPVMLVAEEVPAPQARNTPKPAKLILRERSGKHAPSPRPRSASLPRRMHRRSGIYTPPRSMSPDTALEKDDTPPLPSPPPNRALPPTPPASGSEKQLKSTVGKAPPVPHAYETVRRAFEPAKHTEHIATEQAQVERTSTASVKTPKFVTTKLEARLAALERNNEAMTRQNKLLEAALMAVLKTNGVSPFPVATAAATSDAPAALPLAWENRVARRSAASHGSSGSAGSQSALDVYMNARRGERSGY